MAYFNQLVIVLLAISALHAFEFNEKTTTDDVIFEYKAILHKKTAIVTGASSGLGRETVRSLAMIDCTVIMAVRNYEKGIKVREELITSIMADPHRKTSQVRLEKHLIVKKLDLGSLQSVLDFAKDFYREFRQPLDILVNNAGIMAVPEYTTTTDGFEQQIGVNHLGHYYLSRLLTNKLVQKGGTHSVRREGEGGRVITVSSRAHKYAPEPIEKAIDELERAIENMDSLKNEYEEWRNYGISKAFNILFARELERREGSRGLVSTSCHPGVIKSGLQQFMTEEAIATKTFDKNIEEGAATQVMLAVMPQDEIYPGGYYQDCNLNHDVLREDLKPVYGYFGEGFNAKKTMEYRLWAISEKLILKQGFSFEFTVPFEPQKTDL